MRSGTPKCVYENFAYPRILGVAGSSNIGPRCVIRYIVWSNESRRAIRRYVSAYAGGVRAYGYFSWYCGYARGW